MIADAAALNRRAYDFSEPVDIRAIAVNDALLPELIATRAFQRLKSIRFLGGIDYLLVRVPNGIRGNIRYTRYQHSLGVVRLAHLYCTNREMPPTDRRLVCVAALLHDIGHAPLSHSLEPVFKEVFDLEHHRATGDIISGRVSLGRELWETLRRRHVDIERVIAVISGDEPRFDSFFDGPINFDTIEGILRSHSYVKRGPSILSPEIVTEAAIRRASLSDRNTVDGFWGYKDQVYKYVINSRAGVLADFACQLFLRRHLDQVSAEDYFGTEPQIFRKLPGLRELLISRTFRDDIMRRLDRPIAYKARGFFIDPSGDFFARQDHRRYRQRRVDRVLVPQIKNSINAVEVEQGLFDDDSVRSKSEAFGK